MNETDIRVKEFGLIQVLMPAVITYGINNTIYSRHAVGASYVFNSIESSGWHDVTPLVRGNLPYYRLGPCIAARQVDQMNKNNGIITVEVYEKE